MFTDQQADIITTRDLLESVFDSRVPLELIERWSPRQRAEVRVWASMLRLYAAGHAVDVPEMPVVVRGWK